MRLVLDANILFSALYDMDSTAGRLLLLAIDGEVRLVSTEHVKEEMERILASKLGYSKDELGGLVAALPVDWIGRGIYEEELAEATRILADPADASLLACAAVLGCEVVSGDREVLASKFRKVKVRRLREFKGR
ncbi:MAG: PIN domain-containing protein [Euryarchaeota archaeon]|nr:PIN domain-containing protein [Euryarchaeota archaeon]